MNQELVFTVIAQDKPGIVTTIAEIIKKHDGNWLDSRMSQLAGEFAGIVHVEIDSEQKKILESDLSELSSKDITITIRQAGSNINSSEQKLHEIEIFGNDRPGIVAEVSRLFSEKDINILEFDTAISNAPVAGGVLFHADAVIGVAKGTALDKLQNNLHDLADELDLDIEWTSKI